MTRRAKNEAGVPGKRPAYQHYPGDEQRDSSLLMLTLAEFGLWRRMLNLMHDGEPYGHLADRSGRAIQPKDLARLVGETTAVVVKHLRRLEELRIFSRTDHGVIYSRRMVRDEHNRNVRAAGGPKSLENENVPRPKDGTKDSLKDTFGGSPASAVASASASANDGSRGIEKKRTLSPREKGPALLSQLMTEELLERLPEIARRFFTVFYADATPRRRHDVALQLATLAAGEPVTYRKQTVRAYDAERLDLKCLEILEADNVEEPDSAIAYLFVTLGDTSDNSAPGVRDADERRKDLEQPLDASVQQLVAGVTEARSMPGNPLQRTRAHR